MTNKTNLALVAVCALLLGALARDLAPSTARANDAAAIDRSDVDRIVRALEANAKATAEIASATKAAARCR